MIVTTLRTKSKPPRVGKYLDADEPEYIESFESSTTPLVSVLTPEKRREFETMARATMNDKCARISLRAPKRDLGNLKSRAPREGVSYQTLINALIHRHLEEVGK